MKQIKRFLPVRMLAVSLLISLAAFGCGGGGGSAEDVSLTIWKPFADSQAMQELIGAYQQANPNVRINLVQPTELGYEKDLLNALAAGNGPDIFSINNAWLPQYLDKIVEAPEAQWRFVDFKNDFVPVVVNDFTKDNKIYGAALSVDSLALYYNKNILPANGVYTVPKTWKELESAVRKIARQDAGGYFRQSGIALGLSSSSPGGQINRAEDIVYLFMLQQGAVPWASDLSSPEFDRDVEKGSQRYNPAVRALEFYSSFASPNTLNYNWNTRSDYSIDAFVNGRAAMMINYSYARDIIKQKNATLDFDVASVPQPNLTDPAVNFANYWGDVVSKQAKYPEVAWDFLKFITSKDQLATYYATAKVPSSRKDLIFDQTADPEIGVFADANGTAKSFIRPESEKVDAIFGKMIDSVILRGTDVDDAVDEASSQANSLSRSR